MFGHLEQIKPVKADLVEYFYKKPDPRLLAEFLKANL